MKRAIQTGTHLVRGIDERPLRPLVELPHQLHRQVVDGGLEVGVPARLIEQKWWLW